MAFTKEEIEQIAKAAFHARWERSEEENSSNDPILVNLFQDKLFELGEQYAREMNSLLYEDAGADKPFLTAANINRRDHPTREHKLASILEITEAKIDGIISGEEGNALWNARLAERELTPDETGTFWKLEHWKLDRHMAQWKEDIREDAFWDDLLSVLRQNRASCAALLGARRLEEVILEVKRRRH